MIDEPPEDDEQVEEYDDEDEDDMEGAEWLASVRWDLGDGGGGSPGNADHGEVELLALGGRYFVKQSADGEVSVAEIDAADAEAAIAKFHEDYSN